MRRNDIDWLLQKPIAHRGLHDGNHHVPENSLSSFSLAMEGGYPIELDLHLLADGQVAVFHDANLHRMCGLAAPITAMESSSLRDCRLLHSDSERIPLLEDVLELVAGRVPLLIELKSSRIPGLLEPALYQKLRAYKGLYAVQSFNPFHMAWFARHAPAIPRGQLAGSFPRDRKSRLQWPARSRSLWNSPDFIGYRSAGLPCKRVSSQRRLGRPVLGWTVRSQEEYDRLCGVCDNIVFEDFIPKMPGAAVDRISKRF